MYKINILGMSDFIIHYELGLDNDDFDFEIVEIGKTYYDHLSPLQPRQLTKVRVNGYNFEMKTSFFDSIEFLDNWGCSVEEADEHKQTQIKSAKFDAILKYVNSNFYKRKLKLEK